MGRKSNERIIWVNCLKCHEWKNEKKVEFINIEEGFDGADRLTFKCPECGTKQISKRVG